MNAPALEPAVDRLIDYIARGNYRVGDRLPRIKDLAAELDLGPHAVRDALLQAQTIGFVSVRPRSGAFVRSLDFSSLAGAFAKALPRSLCPTDVNLLDVLEARRVIEVELAATAAARRRLADLVPVREALAAMYADLADYPAYVRHNEAFHLAIAKVAGNPVLYAILKHLIELLRGVLVERQPATWAAEASRKRDTDMREHDAIFGALVAGDAAATRAAMLVHLRDTTDTLFPPAAGTRPDPGDGDGPDR